MPGGRGGEGEGGGGGGEVGGGGHEQSTTYGPTPPKGRLGFVGWIIVSLMVTPPDDVLSTTRFTVACQGATRMQAWSSKHAEMLQLHRARGGNGGWYEYFCVVRIDGSVV